MTVALGDPPALTIVTGAAGWLGTALMHALTDLDGPWGRTGTIRPLVTNRVERERLRQLSGTVEPVIGDITKPATLDALFANAGATDAADVIHTAGVIHPRRVADFEAVNHAGTRNVLATAARHGVRRFVHVSSNSPFGTNAHPGDCFRNDEPYDPYYGYGRSKMAAELAVGEAVAGGLDAVIVRPPWFYGPHQPPRQTTFFKMVRAGKFPVIGTGEQVRSMAYVGNLVQGVLRAELVATPPGRGWWIADARPYPINEIVATVGRALTDEGFDVRPNSARLPAIVGRLAETADALIQRTGRYVQQIHVLGEMDKNIACDIGVARIELGYEPQVELYEGMRRSIRWCLDEGLEL
jgi:nucleoside-diphosphate-sugar epimerase